MSHTPSIKFESPAESLVDSFSSTPGTHYSSLFPEDQTMTPQSFDDESIFGDDVEASLVASEKKPVKKRKSWGQQLPEPKTNLPPRKRAKTEDEKEQRRVERVLRNRRAAQSSRERKRQEVEALEAEKMQVELRNKELEARLAEMEARNTLLQIELEKMAGGNMRVFQGSSAASSPAAEQLRASTPVTFSQELFSSQPTATTVNPASLSPEIRPVPESSNASSSDTTQHPAEMLSDLQCLPEEQRPWMSSTNSTQFLAVTFLLNMISTATSTLLNPLSQIVNSLSSQSYLSPTPSILTLIIWMVTTTASLTTSTSMTSYTNTKTSQRPRFSLRMRLLRRLLACNPHLARPLLDATMMGMRLASEQQLTHACPSSVEASPSQGEQNTPSLEVLTTLCWAIIVISGERPQDSPTLDATTELRQACDELDMMFRQKNISGTRFPIQENGQKSLDYRRFGRHS